MIGGLIKGLSRTRAQVDGAIEGKDLDAALTQLRNGLIMADAGKPAAEEIVAAARHAIGNRSVDAAAIRGAVRDAVEEMVRPLDAPLEIGPPPFVVLVVGVNGGGKTTTIAKVARHWAVESGKSVLVSASDTFRAAAREQLESWVGRLGERVELAKSASPDPSACAFDAVKTGAVRGTDVVLVDTAGRLATQKNLMAELSKIRRVIGKAVPGAPHETIMVVDATLGQSVLSQLAGFDEAVDVTGIALTKLDGTSKGGIAIAIAREHPKPVRFAGVGEGMDDLLPFNAKVFADAIML